MPIFSWDTLKRFLATPQSWTGKQTFSSIEATTADISGVTLKDGAVQSSTMPAFLSQATSVNDVTGDGTVVTVVYDNEVFDQGANLNAGTGVFTAPVAGRYHFDVSVQMNQLDAAHTLATIGLVTSNRTYRGVVNSGYACAAGGSMSMAFSQLTDMDAGDTAYVTFVVHNGTKVVHLIGTTAAEGGSFFSGRLVC